MAQNTEYIGCYGISQIRCNVKLRPENNVYIHYLNVKCQLSSKETDCILAYGNQVNDIKPIGLCITDHFTMQANVFSIVPKLYFFDLQPAVIKKINLVSVIAWNFFANTLNTKTFIIFNFFTLHWEKKIIILQICCVCMYSAKNVSSRRN